MSDRRKITEDEIARFRAERPEWNGLPDYLMTDSVAFSMWLAGDRFTKGVAEPALNRLEAWLNWIARRFGRGSEE